MTAVTGPLPTVGLMLLVNAVVLADVPAPVRALVVVPALVLLPGGWLYRLLGLTRPRGWDTVLHTIACGLLVLLAVSFAVAVLPVPGALSPVGCLVGFDLAMVVLLIVATARLRRTPGAGSTMAPPATIAAGRRGLRVAVSRPVRPATIAVLLAALAVPLAVAGAARLNAGGGPALTILALLAGIAALPIAALPMAALPIAALPVGAPPGQNAGKDAGGDPGKDAGGDREEVVREQLTATAVFLLGLAVLLATSLRGAGVTGHDIKIEMHVLRETLAHGRWTPGGFAPDYNACLSLTTLPSFLHHMAGLAALDIFRICYQVLFAVVPVGVFLLSRRLLATGGAALAAGLFIAFPAFVNDMPSLNRQEIALIFFTVAMIALLDDRMPRRQRLVTFTLMAAGLTVSHYSSTYVTVGILLAGWLLLKLRQRPWFAGSPGPAERRPLLGLPLILLLMAFSIGWSACSGSGGGLIRTVHDTMVAVQRGTDASADAVGYSFFRLSRTERTDEQVLREYIAARAGTTDPHGLDRLAVNCPIRLVPADVLPATAAGRAMRPAIEPATFNTWCRRGAVVLFQVGAVLGVLLLWLTTRASGPARQVPAALGGGALILLAGTVLLPRISLNYGLLRLFQQSLVLFAPGIVLALTAALGPVARRATGVAVAALVTMCLASTSGLLPQLTGGYPPQLNLNNAGSYHRAWYAGPDDVAVARWLDTHLPPDAVLYADSSQTGLLRATTRVQPREGVAPGIVLDGGYVTVSAIRPDRARAAVVADERILAFDFPLRCVAAGRPLLYTRGEHRVYGPVDGAG